MPGPQPRHCHPFIFCIIGRGLDLSATSRQTTANGSPVGEGFIPPVHLPPPPTSAAACGQAALRAPFVVRSVGRSLAPLRGVGDAAPYSGNPQVFSPPPTSAAAWGQAALHPTLPHSVGRGALTPPQPPAIARYWFTNPTTQIPKHKKAGANISFAPAVLLLRSHSLITLFVIFRTVSASSWESSYLYANFDCPFKTLTNCSLDLPSGSLFAQKHLWNGVMFVIKIVLGVVGLMPRTKAS